MLMEIQAFAWDRHKNVILEESTQHVWRIYFCPVMNLLRSPLVLKAHALYDVTIS